MTIINYFNCFSLYTCDIYIFIQKREKQTNKQTNNKNTKMTGKDIYVQYSFQAVTIPNSDKAKQDVVVTNFIFFLFPEKKKYI